jgi:hypothetical protein
MLPPQLADHIEHFQEVSLKVEKMYELGAALEQRGWREKDGFKMVSDSKGSVIQMMCETYADINPFNYCALFYEMDYYHKWLDEGMRTVEEGNLGIAEKASSIRLEISLLSPRRAFVQGMGWDRLASKGELIVIGFDWVNTPYNVKRLGRKLLLTSEEVPIKDMVIMYQLLLKPPKPRFRMVCTVDFEVSLILVPNMVIDGAIGYFMSFMLRNMERLGKDLD